MTQAKKICKISQTKLIVYLRVRKVVLIMKGFKKFFSTLVAVGLVIQLANNYTPPPPPPNPAPKKS